MLYRLIRLPPLIPVHRGDEGVILGVGGLMCGFLALGFALAIQLLPRRNKFGYLYRLMMTAGLIVLGLGFLADDVGYLLVGGGIVWLAEQWAPPMPQARSAQKPPLEPPPSES